MMTTNPIVQNALAAKGRIARNALTVVQQRESQAAIPQVKAELEKYKAEAKVRAEETKQMFAAYKKFRELQDKVIKANRAFIGEGKRIAAKYPSFYWEDKVVGKMIVEMMWGENILRDAIGGAYFDAPNFD